MTRREILSDITSREKHELLQIMFLVQMPKNLRPDQSVPPLEQALALLNWAESLNESGLLLLEEATRSLPKTTIAATSSTPKSLPIHFAGISYIQRPEEDTLIHELAKPHNTISIKGPRGSGRTTLLSQARQKIKGKGERFCMINLQGFPTNLLASLDTLFLAIAQIIDDQFDLPHQGSWRPGYDSTSNFSRYLKRTVLTTPGPFILAFNEIDRLFSYQFAGEFLSQIRALSEASKDGQEGPWDKLSFILTHILPINSIPNASLDFSSFNIPAELVLEDLTLDQVHTLNHQYGNPLTNKEVSDLHQLLGGELGLIQIGFQKMISGRLQFEDFLKTAPNCGGPFDNQLQRLPLLCQNDPEIRTAIKNLLNGQKSNNLNVFYRLRMAGIVNGHEATDMTFRSPLYEQYFRHLLK